MNLGFTYMNNSKTNYTKMENKNSQPGEHLVKIVSNEKGKCCDLYPPMGVFRVKQTENGLEVVTRSSSWIPPEFTVLDLPADTELKKCPYCKTDYLKDEEFLNSFQTGDEPMCLVCYEKRYITGDRQAYRELIRKQVISSIKIRCGCDEQTKYFNAFHHGNKLFCGKCNLQIGSK